MNAEKLRCGKCGKEVRIVRLGKTTLAFGPTTNPGPSMHRVQLARGGQQGATSSGRATPGSKADVSVQDTLAARPGPAVQSSPPRARSRSGLRVPTESMRGTTAVSGAAGRARRAGHPPAPAPRSARSS